MESRQEETEREREHFFALLAKASLFQSSTVFSHWWVFQGLARLSGCIWSSGQNLPSIEVHAVPVIGGLVLASVEINFLRSLGLGEGYHFDMCVLNYIHEEWRERWEESLTNGRCLGG